MAIYSRKSLKELCRMRECIEYLVDNDILFDEMFYELELVNEEIDKRQEKSLVNRE